MKKPPLSRITLNRNTHCSICYDKETDAVELSVGNISIKLNGNHFVLFNEMVRKATAKLVMNSIPTKHYYQE